MKPHALLLACAACLILLTGGASAQFHRMYPDSLYVLLDDDSISMARVTSQGEIFPAEWLCAGYNYQMYADTTCETDFHVTAFKINGHRWKLLNWKTWRIINAPADLLSFNSRTVGTTLHAGDTLTFYRDMSWRDPRTGHWDTNTYKSFDTLTCIVELVRCSDSNRIVLLDSIGILPRPVMGVPIIHGMLPIIVWPHWVVPASLDSVRAFMRVRVRANGSGDYYYTRKEEPTRSFWRRLQEPFWLNILNYLGQIYAKPVIPSTAPIPSSPLLHVRMSTGSTDAVEVGFTTASDGGPTSLAIYDGAGRLLFVPYNSPSSNGHTEDLRYRFESSGLYLVCLIHDNRIVATNKIIIGR